LPAFLSFYLGADEHELPRAPTRILQGLLVGALVSIGFLALFALASLPVSFGVALVARAIPWAGLATGALLSLAGLVALSRVQLAAGQQVERGHRRGSACEFLDQPACAHGREERVAFVHGAYAGDELVPRRRLEEESGGAGAECIDDVLVEIEGGQHQHAQGG